LIIIAPLVGVAVVKIVAEMWEPEAAPPEMAADCRGVAAVALGAPAVIVFLTRMAEMERAVELTATVGLVAVAVVRMTSANIALSRVDLVVEVVATPT
jgi:hypothetical protein